MQLINAPGKLVLPFANAGAKNSIPVASQIGITAGAASLTDGFPPLTRTPLAAGGVPPSGLDMNGIIYELSAILRWANAGGGYVFDNTFASDSNVNGYPKGARVLRSDGLGYWFNTTDNNTTDPESAGAVAAGWVPDFTNGVAAVTMTSANVTLTALQYGKPIVIISGLLTANLNLIFPNIAGQWVVINNTTGAYSITCKTAAGTGVAVTSASAIVGDATNIYQVASGITQAAADARYLQLAGGTLTGLLVGHTGANIASATTLNLSTATGNTVHVTGTTATTGVTMTAGQWMQCVADGAWPLTYHATNNKLNTGGANYTCAAGDSVFYFYDGTTVYGQIVKADGTGVIQSGLQGAFRNLAGSAPGNSAVVTYRIDEVVTGDGAGNVQTTRTLNNTINMTSAGAGGLDTGTVAASTWYYAFAITKSDGTKAAMASLSATAPTMPSGYTKWARIGAFRTDGTANKYPLGFQQYGRRVQYKVGASNVANMPIMASGALGDTSTPTWSAVATGTFIPPTAAVIYLAIFNTSGASTTMAAPNNSYGASTSTTNPPPMVSGNGSGTDINSMGSMTLESSNIYYASSSSSAGLACQGWEDNL